LFEPHHVVDEAKKVFSNYRLAIAHHDVAVCIALVGERCNLVQRSHRSFARGRAKECLPHVHPGSGVIHRRFRGFQIRKNLAIGLELRGLACCLVKLAFQARICRQQLAEVRIVRDHLA
jgi:hypothetical protein